MGKQPITICFAARKGGVGKSFLAVNVGAFLRAEGKRVLIIGCDDQDDIARRYLIETDFDPEDCTTLSDVLLDDLDPHDAIYQTREYPLYRWHSTFGIVTRIRQGRETATLDFMPAGRRMDEITYDSSDGFAPDMLSGIVERVSDEYDYVLFDTPPSDADISMYAYAASSYVLVPFTSVDDFDSIGRVASTIDVINAPKKNGRQYHIELLIGLNRYKSASPLSVQLREAVSEDMGERVLSSTIRDSGQADNAKADGAPLAFYTKTPIGADLYLFTKELIEIVEN